LPCQALARAVACLHHADNTKMLAFTARHGIRPIIATFLMAEADRALDHTRQDTAGFRAVLVA